jgi:hypothetical protein
MGQQHRLATHFLDVLDGRHNTLDTRCIGHFAVFDRHVDIDAGEDDLAVKIHVVEGFEGHIASRFQSFFFRFAFRQRVVQAIQFAERMAKQADHQPGIEKERDNAGANQNVLKHCLVSTTAVARARSAHCVFQHEGEENNENQCNDQFDRKVRFHPAT